jgi:HSP20 family protein
MWDCDIQLYEWFRGFDSGYFNDDLVDFETEKELEDAFTERVYETPEDGIIEFSSFLSAYSMTIELDDKPRVAEIRNIRNAGVGHSRKRKGVAGYGPQITTERESVAEINVYDKEVKVVLEMPGVSKEHINIQAYHDYVEVSSNHPHRKYQVIEIPHVADIKTVRSTYKNGILEIVFKKKEKLNGNNKRREIRIE